MRKLQKPPAEELRKKKPQVGKDKKTGGVRVAPKEPAVEGLIKKGPNYSSLEIEHICRRRKELIADGKKDGEIARIVGGEMGRSKNSIISKIKKLERNGTIPTNPNRPQSFTGEDIDKIAKRREELIADGKKDGEIARIVGEEIGRSWLSVKTKITKLTKEGIIPVNPNALEMRDFTDDEINWIIRRREELIAKGKKDGGMGDIICEEIGRSGGSIREKIKKLIKERNLPANSNKQRKKTFTDEDIDWIIRRREELIAKGKKDSEIGKIIGEELGRNSGSVLNKVKELEDKEIVSVNPNKQKSIAFTDENIKIIIGRREELVAEGKNDAEIGRIIGEEIGMIGSSVSAKITKLEKEGILSENPNKKKQRRPSGFFLKMDNDELVGFAQKVIEKKEITNRIGLRREEKTLYEALRRKGLLDRVFAHIERQADDRARQDVIDALEAFAANDNNSAEDDVA